MTTYKVATSSELATSLSKAVGGDRILLAPGKYGTLHISGQEFSSAVAIEALVSGSAHFDGLFVEDCRNLSFSGLDFGRALQYGEPEWTKINSITDSNYISFSDTKFHGSLDGNPSNDGVGLFASNAGFIRIENSTFTEAFRGISIQSSENLAIYNNVFELLRSDGITMAANRYVSIDRNAFSEFRPIKGDHADAIQFWNTGQERGSTNVSIKNNIMWFPDLVADAGSGVQGVFVGDEGSFGYKTFQVANNLIYSNGTWNGILLSGGQDIQVYNNSVLSTNSDSKVPMIRIEKSNGVLLSGNVADDFMISGVFDLSQGDNVDLSMSSWNRQLMQQLSLGKESDKLLHPSSGVKLPGLMDILQLTELFGERPTRPTAITDREDESTGTASPLHGTPLVSPLSTLPEPLDEVGVSHTARQPCSGHWTSGPDHFLSIGWFEALP